MDRNTVHNYGPDSIYCNNICGSILPLLEDLPNMNPENLIGQPIFDKRDGQNKQIGVIDHIAGGYWYARINCDLPANFFTQTCSIEVKTK